MFAAIIVYISADLSTIVQQLPIGSAAKWENCFAKNV